MHRSQSIAPRDARSIQRESLVAWRRRRSKNGESSDDGRKRSKVAGEAVGESVQRGLLRGARRAPPRFQPTHLRALAVEHVDRADGHRKGGHHRSLCADGHRGVAREGGARKLSRLDLDPLEERGRGRHPLDFAKLTSLGDDARHLGVPKDRPNLHRARAWLVQLEVDLQALRGSPLRPRDDAVGRHDVRRHPVLHCKAAGRAVGRLLLLLLLHWLGALSGRRLGKRRQDGFRSRPLRCRGQPLCLDLAGIHLLASPERLRLTPLLPLSREPGGGGA
mmetsp:Transcript_28300/g.90661  ORF Transcript_28300/g.90661 Transcript_28300/m.90661 type:complete len:277 (-) Transcript_28300:142-972(-)